MADVPFHRRRARLIVAAACAAMFATTTTVLAYLGYLRMFSEFNSYDDEGFMLLSLRSFIEGQPLYEKIVLHYGPFYFEFFRLFAAAGVPFDLDSGRLTTLAVWLLVTLLIGVATLVFTRNLLLGAAAQVVSFAMSDAFVAEPMHPSGLVMLLVIGIEAIALIGLVERPERRWPFIAMGALAAAAVLTKINVGGFAVIAIAFACALTIPALSRNPFVRLIAAAVVVLVPFVLMKTFLGQDWAQRYATDVSLGALAVVIATSASDPEPARRPTDVLWLVVGGTALTVVVVAIAVLAGSSLGGLVRGVVIDPLQQPEAFLAPLPLPTTTVRVALVGAGGAVVWVLYRLLLRRPEPAIEGLARIVAGLAIWFTLLGSIHIPGVLQLNALSHGLLLPIVLAWVVVAPRSTREGWAPLDFARVLLAVMAVLQGLQAYPVAGSQIVYGELPLVPLGAVCINDGLVQLNLSPARRQVAAAILLMVVAVSWLPPTWRHHRDLYNANVPLALPGARLVRLPADQAATLTQITEFVHQNCDTYISIPGMDSFYIWAQVPPPSPPTRWIWLIDDVPHQQAVVDTATRVNRVCVIENQQLIDFWTQGNTHVRGPIDEYVSGGFVVAEVVGAYTILVRR